MRGTKAVKVRTRVLQVLDVGENGHALVRGPSWWIELPLSPCAVDIDDGVVVLAEGGTMHALVLGNEGAISPVGKLVAHVDPIVALCVSSGLVATIGSDGSATLWNAKSGTLLWRFFLSPDHPEYGDLADLPFSFVSILPSKAGVVLASPSWMAVLPIPPAPLAVPPEPLVSTRTPLSCAWALVPGNKTLLGSVTSDHQLLVWDLKSCTDALAPVTLQHLTPMFVKTMAYDPAGRVLVVADELNIVHIFTPDGQIHLQSFTLHATVNIRQVRIAGDLLFVSTWNSQVRAYRLA